jgi:putative FmdB family regulatory protein
MPIYEYRCDGCGARLSRFVRSIGAEVNVGTCERCGSADLRRLISRVAIVRGPVDPNALNKNELLDGVSYTDPASMANFFRRMGDAFHDEPNEHMDEIIGRLDHGEEVHKALDLHMHDHSHDGGASEGGGESGGE